MLNSNLNKIAFGGGSHWCTEAVFQSLRGVSKVEQGWVASTGENDTFSEAVIVHYDTLVIDLTTLTAIHLHTHSCTSTHPMRKKYRSAIYVLSATQVDRVWAIIEDLQSDFDRPIITQILPFVSFKENQERYRNYYQKHPGNQFCTTYIHPKLKLLREQFAQHHKPLA